MRELRPLKLPLLVEARKNERQEMMAAPDSTFAGFALYRAASSSSAADIPSPTTPTFSVRGHSRFPSSNSSLSSSPILRESMDGLGSQKRPLTEVKEEPQEREEDHDMIDVVDQEAGRGSKRSWRITGRPTVRRRG